MGKFIGCYFEFGHMIREKMIFKDISYLELLSPFCSAERKICTILVEDIIRNKSIKLFCLFVLLLYVPSQQLWSLRDGQFN